MHDALNSRLLNAEQLLEQLFEADCRPSVRWLRTQQKRKTVPLVKVGRLVFFELEAVRAALAKNNVVAAKNA